MSAQPEALRIAAVILGPDGLASWHREDAAAELRRLSALEADAQRFRVLCETSPVLCFMGQDCSSADEFRAAIDAYAKG